MTGPEHYREAQAELMADGGCEYGCPHCGCVHEMAHIARAQVHATLALAAATALTGGTYNPPQEDMTEWRMAAGNPTAAEAARISDEQDGGQP